MTKPPADELTIADLEQKIRDHFGTTLSDLLFTYCEQEGKIRLDLITVNPRHHQSFLFHTTVGVDRLDAVDKMYDYVRSYRSKENSYTVQWKVSGDNELHTSYFRARNMYEALDKLYHNRDILSLTVFNVVLNPVS